MFLIQRLKNEDERRLIFIENTIFCAKHDCEEDDVDEIENDNKITERAPHKRFKGGTTQSVPKFSTEQKKCKKDQKRF